MKQSKQWKIERVQNNTIFGVKRPSSVHNLDCRRVMGKRKNLRISKDSPQNCTGRLFRTPVPPFSGPNPGHCPLSARRLRPPPPLGVLDPKNGGFEGRASFLSPQALKKPNSFSFSAWIPLPSPSRKNSCN